MDGRFASIFSEDGRTRTNSNSRSKVARWVCQTEMPSAASVALPRANRIALSGACAIGERDNSSVGASRCGAESVRM